jgi:hypothetical protein
MTEFLTPKVEFLHREIKLGNKKEDKARACDAKTWKIIPRGLTSMRSNSPFPSRRGNISNPRANTSAKEKAIVTTDAHNNVWPSVNPSTSLKRRRGA